mgnify:CR=1 FL=1
MMNLNNKGQSLVLFILLIPIIVLVMILVIDIGNLYCEKKELDSISYLVCNYGVTNYDDESVLNDMVKLANLNSNKLSKVFVDINDGKVDVVIGENVDGIFGKMLNINIFNIKIHYVGDIVSGNMERIK